MIHSIHFGTIDNWAELQEFASTAARCIVISDDNVAALYADQLLNQVQTYNHNCDLITFKAGEQSKTRETKSHIEDQLLALGCGRDTLIIALGGGVVTDLAGFVAATFCRGVPVMYIPTSLMGMVDASLGGKTAVNTTHGKNMIGAFNMPQSICIDPTYLHTLPDAEYRSATAEMIKHALILDASYFKNIKQNIDRIKQRDLHTLTQMIKTSIELKMQVIKQDLHELGAREHLNFGHTLGHAIEAASSCTVAHGFAVAWGIYYEALLSNRYASLSDRELGVIIEMLNSLELLVPLPNSVTPERILEAIIYDKKARSNLCRVVLLDRIGSVDSLQQLSVSEIATILD